MRPGRSLGVMANFELRTNGSQSGQEQYKKHKNNDFIQCEEGPGVVAYLLTLGRLSNTIQQSNCQRVTKYSPHGGELGGSHLIMTLNWTLSGGS